MSTVLYGRLQSKREESVKGPSAEGQSLGVGQYADTLAALVPAEVLAASVVLVTEFTHTTKVHGKETITVTDPSALKWGWWGCICFAVLFYVAAHIKGGAETNRWDRWDFLRMLVPAGAFVAWTAAVQPATMLKAAWGLGHGGRVLMVVFGAVFLGLIAGLLGTKVDKKEPDGEQSRETANEAKPPQSEAHSWQANEPQPVGA